MDLRILLRWLWWANLAIHVGSKTSISNSHQWPALPRLHHVWSWARLLELWLRFIVTVSWLWKCASNVHDIGLPRGDCECVAFFMVCCWRPEYGLTEFVIVPGWCWERCVRVKPQLAVCFHLPDLLLATNGAVAMAVLGAHRAFFCKGHGGECWLNQWV